MIKENLEKRYKVLKWIQYITFVMSIVSCTVPLIIACFRVVPAVKSGEERWSIVGVAAVITSVILLIVLRSLVRKVIDKLPYTLVVLVSVVVMLIAAICLKRIIDDAIAVLWVAAISCAVAFVLELTSMFCKIMADNTKEEYGRIE